MPTPVPVIFDTDIGNDVDDTWAIAMALNCPELEIRFVLTAGPGLHTDRAKMVAKLLDAAEVRGVPIGKGCDDEAAKPGNAAFEGELPELAQSPWVADYDLGRYSGEVFDDGVGELIRIVMASDEPLTLIAIGPLGNVGEALRREPRIAQKLHFVGMHGAIYAGYGGRPVDPVKGWEYNVWADIPSSQATFNAPFLSMTISPLDTCGLVQLTGDHYERVKNSRAPLARAVIESYEIWWPRFGAGGPLAATTSCKPYALRTACVQSALCINLSAVVAGFVACVYALDDYLRRPWLRAIDDVDAESSVLFDTVAVYLAYATALCTVETLPIEVTDDGVTRIAAEPERKARTVACAVYWKDLGAFHAHLVERLCNENISRL